MSVRNPWSGQQVEVVNGSSGAVVVSPTTAATLSVPVTAGSSYLVEQTSSLTTSLAFAQLTGTQATAYKSLGGVVQIGIAGSGGSSEAPYGGTAAAIPGTVQAENYDTGGQGVAYDFSSVNGTGTGYRSDGVDLETTSDTGGGYDLGWTATGQWTKYTVNVATAGTYTVALRVAAPNAVTDALHIANSSGTNLSGDVNIASTGGWQTWTTVNATVTLPAGTQTLTVDQDNGGWNLNYLTFASSGSGGINTSAWYEVVNQNSGLCASAAGGSTANSTAVEQLACTGATSQRWQFAPTSVSGYYEVVNENSQSEGESWNITGGVGATASGDLLQTWNYGGTGNTNALFAANPQTGGYYTFTADNSGLCIDTPSASTASGVQLQQYTCNGTAAQSFQLVQ
ncbi:carbohydrate-binding protein [Actinospica durhamensis]|uniref:Carbohydrate-binding protein n=2 Tax=Actinospica durhamensis TaxID=1508375 RepID=A0A941EN61_9ACTN|nr:carbohydrate-binding protein [Actinospica durhamensis]